MQGVSPKILVPVVYGGRERIPAGVAAELVDKIKAFRRQALHAERLGFVHPRERHEVVFEAPPPADFAELLEALDQYD